MVGYGDEGMGYVVWEKCVCVCVGGVMPNDFCVQQCSASPTQNSM